MRLEEWTTAASAYASEVDRIFWLLVVISALITLLVMALVVTFIIRYRRGSTVHRGELPEPLKHEVEIGWTVATLFLFLFIFWWADTAHLEALTPPSDALEIHVVGKQWMWRFQHPNGAREIDTLHLPAQTPVRLAMTSEDVIHDLYLPALRLKQDILPGRTTYLWFTADKTGTFYLTCAEFCGTDHSRMGGKLVIMPPDAYARWSAAQPQGDDLAHEGATLFRTLGCSGCHTPGASVRAPDLRGVYGRLVHLSDGRTVKADDAYLRDSILLPRKDIVAGFEPIMPSFAGVATEGDLIKLIAYLKSLGTATGERAAQPGQRQ